jgi:hypothetical protein
MRVLIGVVSNRDPKREFANCLLNLAGHVAQFGPQYGIESYALRTWGNVSNLCKGRRALIDCARHYNQTHILFIDDDMAFPLDALQTLASRGVQMIGVNAVCKEPKKLTYTALDIDGASLCSKGKTGIEEVSHVGFGMTLLEVKALENIAPPYFEMLNDGEIGEDAYFCSKLRKNGIKIYVDHDVSQNMGHVGDFTYTLNSYS